MGQVSAGMLGIGRSARSTGNEMSLAEKQTRAFGTTLRYAFAGSVIFGITSMVGKLSQLQQQLGLIAAISGPAGTNLTGGALSQLEDEIASKAVAARTPISELNDSVINFLSTVQGAKPTEIPEIVAKIGMAARLSQTPTEDLTKAVTTLNLAAGRKNNLETINGLLREWYDLISKAPGGITAAPQIAQQLGPLGAVAMRLGRMTPEQMFGFTLGALRYGATPSVGLRGVQYFMQSLFQPGKDQGKVLARAGFTPDRLQREGPTKFILDYLKYVRSLGARSTAKGRGVLQALGEAGDVSGDIDLAPNVNVPGLSPQAQAFLRASIGRIHGIRTAAVLLGQLDRQGNVASLQETISNINDIWQGIGKDANELERSSARYRQQTPLQSAAIALDTLRVAVSRDIAPVLGLGATGLTKGADFLRGHTQVRHGVEVGAAAFMAALLGKNLGIFGKLGRFGKLAGGLTNAGGQAFVTSTAVQAMATGGTALGATPQNPLFVIVVGQIFGGRDRKSNWFSDVFGDAKTITLGGAGAAAAKVSRRAMLGRWLKGMGIPLTAAWIGSHKLEEALGLPAIPYPTPHNFAEGIRSIFEDPIAKGQRGFNKVKYGYLARAMMGGPLADSPFSQDVLSKFQAGFISPYTANRRLERIAMEQSATNLKMFQRGFPGKGTITADGILELNIKVTDPAGRQSEKRLPMPVTYSGGKVPNVRGRRKTIRTDIPIRTQGGQ